MLDYLGSDYKNAVRGGKVTNQDEYAEMQEFAKRSLDLSAQLQGVDKSDKGGIKPILTSLAERIANKADAELISALAGDAKAKLIAAYNIIPYPKTLPTLADGKKIFDDNCAQCHGPSGRGPRRGRPGP